MKKTNFLKIALTFVMVLAITGAFAQVADVEYSQYDAGAAAPADIDYVTVGATMGYYAEPDAVYHPLYVTPAWTLDAGGVWTWTVPTDPGTAAVLAYPGTKPANYVQITFPVVGNYVVNVAESYAGGCSDVSPSVMNTTAINAPTAAVTGAAADASWNTVTASFEYNRCSALAGGELLTATFTETGVPAALAQYAYGVQKVVTGYAADGSVVVAAATTTLVDHPTTAKVNGGAIGGGSYALDGTGALSYVQFGGNDVRTKYEFTLIKASDAPGAALDGIISQISHKSDYIAIEGGGVAKTYAFAGNTVTYWINLPPVTGPIYHIPNTYTY